MVHVNGVRVAPSLFAFMFAAVVVSLPQCEGGHEVSGDGPEGEERAYDPAAHLHQLAELADLRGLLRSHEEVARSLQTVQKTKFVN